MDEFFSNLMGLGVEGGLLSLGSGIPTSEFRHWLDEHSVADPARPVLPTEFHGAPVVLVVQPTLEALADFARREPCPVIAVHLCVCTTEGSLLEWYDRPFDPISVAPSIAEECVAAFAAACDAGYRISHGPVA